MKAPDRSRDLEGQGRTLSLLVLLALAARLPLWLGAPGAAYDMESYRLTAQQVWQGGALYGNPVLAHRYPYLPLWALVLEGLRGLALGTGLPDTVAFKFPAVAADCGIVVLLYRMMRRLHQDGPKPQEGLRSPAFWAALAYAANPLALLISAGHGQFDSTALFFLLLAVYFADFSRLPSSDRYAALSLAAAVALKSWPAFFIPLFVRNLAFWKERLAFLGWLAAPLAALCLPFVLHSPSAFFRTVGGYAGATALSLPQTFYAAAYLVGPKALGAYRLLMQSWTWLCLGLLALVWLAFFLARAAPPILPGMVLGTLTLYVLAPAYSVQYLLWLLPFSLLAGGGLAFRHTLYGLAMLVFFYLSFLPGAVLPFQAGAPSLPPWMILLWAVLNLGLWLFWLLAWRKAAWDSGLAGS
jgi:hypothetical protein